MFLKIEAALSVLALVLAFIVPRLGSRWFEALERRFGKLARRRGLSVVVVGLTALALRLALLPILPIPVPSIPDEFGYLLLSDTFAHGRLTNPASPMWVHFESIHILWQPTYTAKFWPAQGLFMALGQAVFGHPFWGIWLSVGIMCAAITWMLQAWVGEGWALLGGFLAVIRLGSFSYWANSYTGGAAAAIGGALVLGALPRMKQERRVRYALLMGVGFAILANSRPYEGLFFGIPVATALLVWLWKLRRPELGQALKRAVVPLLAVLALTLVAMGYYFWRTTGSQLKSPYTLYEETYDPVPIFPWQPLKATPAYRHEGLHRYYLETEAVGYKPEQTVPGLAEVSLVKLVLFWSFYLGSVFTVPLLVVAMSLPVGFSWNNIGKSTRFLLIAVGFVIVANMLPIWYGPHYSAPITSALIALLLIAMRRIQSWRWQGKSTGPFIIRAVPSICVLLLVLASLSGPLHFTLSLPGPGNNVPTWCWQAPPMLGRAKVLQRLRGIAGGQLVIVRYGPGHEPEANEWVYNSADIPSAKVIWARDMGSARNEELIKYFKGRQVWLVNADDYPPKLQPYSSALDRQSQKQLRGGR